MYIAQHHISLGKYMHLSYARPKLSQVIAMFLALPTNATLESWKKNALESVYTIYV